VGNVSYEQVLRSRVCGGWYALALRTKAGWKQLPTYVPTALFEIFPALDETRSGGSGEQLAYDPFFLNWVRRAPAGTFPRSTKAPQTC